MRRVFVLKELSNKKYTKRIRAEREREKRETDAIGVWGLKLQERIKQASDIPGGGVYMGGRLKVR